MAERKRLLCIVYEPGNFQVWLKLAARGRTTGGFDVILWSPYCLPDSARYQAEALAAGTVYVEEATSAGGLADIYTRLTGWLASKPIRLPSDLQAKVAGYAPPGADNSTTVADALVADLTDGERYAVWSEVDRIRRRINFCEDWLVQLGIDAVVLAEDNVERDSYGWIEGARRRGIMTAVSSYGAISDQEAVTAYKSSSSHAVDARRATLIRRHLPHWLAEGDGFAITRLPFVQAVARELTATAPFNPWLVNAGHADAIAVESSAMKQAYSRFGFPAAKLKPIGHPLQDVLAVVAGERRARRTALFAQYNLPAHRQLAVVAMPPDQLASRSCVYRQYADVVSAFARLPGELTGANVVVSPHPNISAEGRALIRATGAVLVETTVADLLPLADLYICSVSSTIKWALGCGIPVIDFDCYGYGYADYRELPQVMSAVDESGFRTALLRFGDPAEQAQLGALATRGSEYWGAIDGMALDRLLELLFEVKSNDTRVI
ncbi:MAG: hypothetical protein Q8Q80_01740 [Methyloversatilis sp.]|uniref:hypothetical protein n=1 Tax=Methyloversatilis sp. TaxID=2569862 RepID=UPI0027351216|nr:hypothetical protein [Methyloversatilis sp.]MDP3871360.1 hypothetical protein [Methyloversatilis sp.]